MMKKRVQRILYFFWRHLPAIRGNNIYWEGNKVVMDFDSGFRWNRTQRLYNWTLK